MAIEIAAQGSDAWHLLRMGKATASRFSAITRNKSDTDFGAGAYSYAYELAAERLTRVPAPSASSPATSHGHEFEPKARAAYSWATGRNVTTRGFVAHPSHEMAGASVDGVVEGEGGLVEIKCPFTSREHARTLSRGAMPSRYVAQVQGQMWVTGSDWCDYVSYHPDFPAGLDLVYVRVARNDDYIGSLSRRVVSFLDFVETITGKCNAHSRERNG